MASPRPAQGPPRPRIFFRGPSGRGLSCPSFPVSFRTWFFYTDRYKPTLTHREGDEDPTRGLATLIHKAIHGLVGTCDLLHFLISMSFHASARTQHLCNHGLFCDANINNVQNTFSAKSMADKAKPSTPTSAGIRSADQSVPFSIENGLGGVKLPPPSAERLNTADIFRQRLDERNFASSNSPLENVRSEFSFASGDLDTPHGTG